MDLVFISNEIILEHTITGHTWRKSIVTREGLNKIIDQTNLYDGNTVFIIDVHCTFQYGRDENKRQLKLQEQGGVIIYRHLLKQFGDAKAQDKLKVVFYSPISAKQLVQLKPENYVLKLLPFVELFPKDLNGNDILDWTFEKALQVEINKNNFSVFNNASENLLSGYALYQADKKRRLPEFVESYFRTKQEIKECQKGKSKQIVFIDDQIEEWETTYKRIFENDSDLCFLKYDRQATNTCGFDFEKIPNFGSIQSADLIVSDFYLEENHETNHWMNEEELSGKSGFRLYQTIKGKKGDDGINKAIPYVMHTSSNKVQYFKFLNSHGVDDWITKDNRCSNLTTKEKQTNFQAFKSVIEEFTSGKNSVLYEILKDFWQKIVCIEHLSYDNWAFTRSRNSVEVNLKYRQYDKKEKIMKNVTCISSNANADTKKVVVELLKDSWFILRTFVSKQKNFSDSIGSQDKNYTPASICSNLGKLFEFYGFNQKMGFNMVFRYIFSIRNASSHYSDYHYFTIEDCLIYFDLWLTILADAEQDLEKFFQKKNSSEVIRQDKGGGKGETFTYRLLYCHIQFYNSRYSSFSKNSKVDLLQRIEQIFNVIKRQPLIDEANESDELRKAISNYDESQKFAKKIKLDTVTYTDKVFIVNA